MKFNYSFLMILFSGFSLIFSTAIRAQDVHKSKSSLNTVIGEQVISSMKSRYKAARTWQERRDLCIEAIDTETIQTSSSLAQIVEMLTLDDIPPIVTEDLANEGVIRIFFERQPELAKGVTDRSNFRVGWYFIAKYRKGKILSYCLTNVHKAPAPIPVIGDK
ncbi:hypothetical protein BH11VER1_BH11VER1_12110 [soil metagenome]